ncbi:MAG: Swt1 family HEPN domain-containing protein [Promethearchaeota archaeon]
MNFRKIDPNVKSLYAFLKRYDIEKYFLTKDFRTRLMELNFDDHWDLFYKSSVEQSSALVFLPEYTGYADEAFLYLLNMIYLSTEKGLIGFLDYILGAFINNRRIENFDFEELKQRLLACKFKSEELKKMDVLRTSDKTADLSTLLDHVKIPGVLPVGVDYNKYKDIIGLTKLPIAMFKFIFVCENILRKFIIRMLDEKGYKSIESIRNAKLTKAIQNRKNQEKNQNYLPIRGDHDIYYLDLIQLNKIFKHLWNECFSDKIGRQSWICERIQSLYDIRNRVAHNSGYLTIEQLKSTETFCREIIKQIDQYIE